MKRVALILLVALAAPAWGLDFDANGKRLDPEPDRQREYQWKDPRTGETVTKTYPPANLKMRQTGRSADGWITYLEVEGKAKFEDAVNLSTPQSTENADQSESALSAQCLSELAGHRHYKDPNSLRIEGTPHLGFSTATGEVRRSVTMLVNGKNSYGAYAGAKHVTCVFAADNKKVLLSVSP
jgi:hypothetical protein